MKASDKLIEAIKQFEGCRLTAYKCPAGVWTIGYGTTKDVKQGQKITESQAEQLLRQDLEKFELQLNNLKLKLTQPQYDACLDFIYNCGIANFKSSTLLKKIIAKAPEAEIKYQFSRWNKAAGKVLAGLTKRREWEANRFFEKN